MSSNYLNLRNFILAIAAVSATLAPAVIEIRRDLNNLKKDLTSAETKLSQLQDALFFIAANSQSGDREQMVRGLERLLERESPYMPPIDPENIPYQIELFITPPKDLY